MTASSHQSPGVRPPLTPVPPNPMAAAVNGYRAAQAQARPQPAAATSNQINAYVDQIVDAIATAPTAQARATLHAELEQAAEDAQSLQWFYRRYLATAPLQAGCEAVRRLCRGRPATHHLPVWQILAALDGHTAARTMTVTWDGIVHPPAGDRPGEKTLVMCKTGLGGDAVLELDDAERLDLGDHLTASLHTAQTCPTPGCGTSDAEIDAADPPPLTGWVLVDVAGTEDAPRWWCRPVCAFAAMTAAGVDLATADRAAATDPHQQAPTPPTPDTGGAGGAGPRRFFIDDEPDADGFEGGGR